MAKKGNAVPAPPPGEDDYRCEDDHRTLTRAEEIRSDAKRMAGVRKHHRKTIRAVKRMDRVVGRGR